MKNVEGLITHLARNSDFGAEFFFLEELKTILVKCQGTTLAKFAAWMHCSAILQRVKCTEYATRSGIFSFPGVKNRCVSFIPAIPRSLTEKFEHAILVRSNIFKTTRILFVFD